MFTYSQTIQKDPKTLKHYEHNAKIHDKEQINALSKNMKKIGFVQTNEILLTEDGVIINGHGRTMAAIKAGLKTVPVKIIQGATEEEINMLRLSDNNFARTGMDTEKILLSLGAIGSKIELSDDDLFGMGFKDLEIPEIRINLSLDDISLDDIEASLSETQNQTEQTLTKDNGDKVTLEERQIENVSLESKKTITIFCESEEEIAYFFDQAASRNLKATCKAI